MKLANLPRYAQDSTYRGPVDGAPAVRAMRRYNTAVVDADAFLYAVPLFDDAFYLDEPGKTGRDMLVSAWFAKGNARFNIETRASVLAGVLGMENIPEEWLVF